MQNNHYSQKYFDFQKNVGEFGAMMNKFKFAPFVKKNHVVIDFGCGGGYLLKSLSVKKKLGVEVNPVAIKEAKKNGIVVHSKTSSFPNEVADVIISNNALEHVDNPLEELTNLRKKLKKNGRLVLIVPHERGVAWQENNIHQHLFTWSPMNLGNLVTRAGFQVERIDYIKHKWPPIYYQQIHALIGNKLFNFLCYIYGHLNLNLIQVRVVARKK